MDADKIPVPDLVEITIMNMFFENGIQHHREVIDTGLMKRITLSGWYCGLTFFIVRNFKRGVPRIHYVRLVDDDGEILHEGKTVFVDNITPLISSALDIASDLLISRQIMKPKINIK